MTLKQQMEQDNQNIFFDLDVFAEIHTINDVAMSIVIDNETLKKISVTQKEHTDGIFINGVLFYVSMEELVTLPSVGSILYLDSVMYIVVSAKEYGGIAEIILEEKTSW